MSVLYSVLSWMAFILALLVLLLSPWLFGSWEQWWFWPFTACILLATSLLALREAVCPSQPGTEGGDVYTESAAARVRHRYLLAASFLPFLIYATIRTFQADVWMDAERIWLLNLTAFLLALQMIFGFTPAQRSLAFALLAINLLCLGAYGIANHVVNGSRCVLWAPAYPGYLTENRASGSYFCPNHFSGIMEFAVAIGAACLLVRRAGWPARIAGLLLVAVGLSGVLISKSRGGGLTVLVMVPVALAVGLSTWSRGVRWIMRIGVTGLAVALVAAFAMSNHPFMQRFRLYFPYQDLRDRPAHEIQAEVVQRLAETSRGRMITAAWRAWRTTGSTRLWGIGPGMHQNLWPRIAATPDGNRANGTWPSMPNYDFHSYEVHSDWVQLLEEFGLVGFLLFLLPTVAVGWFLLPRSLADPDAGELPPALHVVSLSGILVLTAMAAHSLGDFNLQIPATTWVFAALLALPLGQLHGKTDAPDPDDL